MAQKDPNDFPIETPIKTCRVCFKRFDSRLGWQVESHIHQGQGPTDSAKREHHRG